MASSRKKVGALIMAFLVMCSTMSFSMDMHFCGKTLVDLKFYQQAETCGMNMPGMEMAIEGIDSHCCSDLSLVIPGQDELQVSFDTPTFEQPTFLPCWAFTYLPLVHLREEAQDLFRDYVPPPLIRNVQVMDQTFLI
jgi:hypothetical protein